MQRLRRAKAVENLDAKTRFPLLKQLCRKRLTCRHTETETGKMIRPFGFFHLQHRSVKRRHPEKDCRLIAMKRGIHSFGSWTLRHQHSRRPRVQGKGHATP